MCFENFVERWEALEFIRFEKKNKSNYFFELEVRESLRTRPKTPTTTAEIERYRNVVVGGGGGREGEKMYLATN